jgi:hypothetical protein
VSSALAIAEAGHPNICLSARTDVAWNRKVWTYTDAMTTPLGGIKRMKIIDRSRAAARRVGVNITGMRSTYPVVAADDGPGTTLSCK